MSAKRRNILTLQRHEHERGERIVTTLQIVVCGLASVQSNSDRSILDEFTGRHFPGLRAATEGALLLLNGGRGYVIVRYMNKVGVTKNGCSAPP